MPVYWQAKYGQPITCAAADCGKPALTVVGNSGYCRAHARIGLMKRVSDTRRKDALSAAVGKRILAADRYKKRYPRVARKTVAPIS